MARRRVISAELLVDEEFNSLSLEAQCLFLRMLCITDDYGIVPTNEIRLCAVLNLPQRIRDNVISFVDEIVSKRLGFRLEVENKPFFVFKPASFKFWQAQLLSRRQKSEYLRMSGEEVLKLFSEQLQVNLEDFRRLPKTSELRVESRKQRVESRKQEEEGSEQKAGSESVDPNPSQLLGGVSSVHQSNGGASQPLASPSAAVPSSSVNWKSGSELLDLIKEQFQLEEVQKKNDGNEKVF